MSESKLTILNQTFRFRTTLAAIELEEPNFYEYLAQNWLRRLPMWAYAYQPQLATFGNRTNNRVEAANRALKRTLRRRDPLVTTISKIWTYENRNLLEKDQRTTYMEDRTFDYPVHYLLEDVIHRLTPPMANVVYQNWRVGGPVDIVRRYGADDILCRQGSKKYNVNLRTATCTCLFNVDMQLPCRHITRIYTRLERSNGLFSYIKC